MATSPWTSAPLRLTDRSRAVLQAAMAEINFDAVACVMWVLDEVSGEGVDGRHLGPGWGVGFHPRAEVPDTAITEIEGIPFTFAADSARKISGGELDFVDGRFVVRSSG